MERFAWLAFSSTRVPDLLRDPLPQICRWKEVQCNTTWQSWTIEAGNTQGRELSAEQAGRWVKSAVMRQKKKKSLRKVEICVAMSRHLENRSINIHYKGFCFFGWVNSPLILTMVQHLQYVIVILIHSLLNQWGYGSVKCWGLIAVQQTVSIYSQCN